MQCIPTIAFVVEVEIGVFVNAVEVIVDNLLASVMKTHEILASQAL